MSMDRGIHSSSQCLATNYCLTRMEEVVLTLVQLYWEKTLGIQMYSGSLIYLVLPKDPSWTRYMLAV